MYSTKDAAARLGLSQDHIRYLVRKGDIEGKKLGRDWVVLSLDYKRKRKPKSKPNIWDVDRITLQKREEAKH
jgi:excisionase family DNA binding protein